MTIKKYLKSVMYGFYGYGYLPLLAWRGPVMTTFNALGALIISLLYLAISLTIPPILGILGLLTKARLGND